MSTLPEGVDTPELLDTKQRYQVGFQPGVSFSSQGGMRRRHAPEAAFHDIPRWNLASSVCARRSTIIAAANGATSIKRLETISINS